MEALLFLAHRFQHLSGNERYAQIPVRLRMQAIRSHGADPADFELWRTTVSATNGCGTCVVAHENVLKAKGMVDETIVAAVRIAKRDSRRGGGAGRSGSRGWLTGSLLWRKSSVPRALDHEKQRPRSTDSAPKNGSAQLPVFWTAAPVETGDYHNP